MTRSVCLLLFSPTAPFRQTSQCMSCSATLSTCVLIALANSVFMTSSYPCHMYWSTCCSKACVSTPNGRGHSWLPSAVGKVYREFAVEHGTCHAFLYACTHIFCRPFNSLCDHLMRAAENWQASIPFCAKCLAESSGVSGWLLIKSRAIRAFSRMMILIAFVTISSGLLPLIEGLCVQILFLDLRFSVVCIHIFCFSLLKAKSC